MNRINMRMFLAGSIFVLYSTNLQPFTISQADIVNGLVINQSGSWELTETVTFNVPYAVTINAPNVTLDLQENTIQAGTQGAVAILIAADNCEVLNGTIQSSTDTAIEISQASGAIVNSITMQDCFAGISATDSDYTTIESCSIAGAQAPTIVIEDSPHTIVKSISITECSSDGIIVTGTSTSSLISQINMYQCTGGNGITVSSDSVTLNYIVIYSLTGDAVTLNGNNAQLMVASIAVNSGNGCIVAGTGTRLQQCSFSKNGINGILLQSTSANTQIYNCQSSGNGNIGVNNLGDPSNTASYTFAHANTVRDFWRIISTP